MAESDLTFARVRELLNYDAETGVFCWATSRAGAALGAKAGSINVNGYVIMKIDRQRVLAHRLAWFWITACWPPHDVDHKSGRRDDNRLSELRPVTRGTNLQNQRRAKSHNRCGLLGVRIDYRLKTSARKFIASIVIAGKQIRLGSFYSAEDAHAAYVAAKRQHHPACTL